MATRVVVSLYRTIAYKEAVNPRIHGESSIPTKTLPEAGNAINSRSNIANRTMTTEL